MTTVAITGVSGFIGAAVARRYADAGATVRGLDTRLPDAHNPLTPDPDPRVDYLVGDVTDLPSLRRLVEGADIVVHTAAIVAESGDWHDFDRVNAQAPRWAALAARSAKQPCWSAGQASVLKRYFHIHPRLISRPAPKHWATP